MRSNNKIQIKIKEEYIMYKFELILYIVSLSNFIVMVISLFTKNKPILYTTCAWCCVLLVVRIIVLFNKMFKRKEQYIEEQANCMYVNRITEEQAKNAYELICRLEKLTNIIESKCSYYEAQKHYIEIIQIINGLNEQQLQDYQRLEILEVLNVLEGHMLKLELKR